MDEDEIHVLGQALSTGNVIYSLTKNMLPILTSWWNVLHYTSGFVR